jgi:hypothetical protein
MEIRGRSVAGPGAGANETVGFAAVVVGGGLLRDGLQDGMVVFLPTTVQKTWSNAGDQKNRGWLSKIAKDANRIAKEAKPFDCK